LRPSTSRSACWCRRASAQIGIKATINKITGANWRTELNKKVLPLYTNVFSGWLDYPGILLHLVLPRQEFRLQHNELPEQGARQADRRRRRRSRRRRQGDLRQGREGFVDLAYADMPRIPLFQPYSNVAMQKNISGYQYWFHRRLDYRALVKG
jgi:peptide/nickel transport system substrate-binding protein